MWHLSRLIFRGHDLRARAPGHHSSSSPLRRLPIPVNAPRPSARTIMRIVNHPINHRCQVFRHAHHQSPRRQLIRPQVHRTSRPNLHRRSPNPPQRFHHSLDRSPVNPSPRITNPPLPLPRPFMQSGPIHPLINLLIRPPRSNRNRPDNAIARRAPIPSLRPSPIIKPKVFPHFRPIPVTTRARKTN
jgi:hypothetical protein